MNATPIHETEERIVGIYADQMRKDWKDYFSPQNRRLARLAIFRIAGEEMKGEYLDRRREGFEISDAYNVTCESIDQFAEQMKKMVEFLAAK